jgi:hypothetical protein
MTGTAPEFARSRPGQPRTVYQTVEERDHDDEGESADDEKRQRNRIGTTTTTEW